MPSSSAMAAGLPAPASGELPPPTTLEDFRRRLDAYPDLSPDVFALLEKTMTQPLSVCEHLWEAVETNERLLRTLAESTNHLSMLKLVNELLRRLSPRHSRFRGRILLLVARLLPLSQESGVNKNRLVFEENPLHIETKEAFTGDKADFPDYDALWQLQAVMGRRLERNKLSDASSKLQLIKMSDLDAHLDKLTKVLALLGQVKLATSVEDAPPALVGGEDESATGLFLPSGKLFRLQLADPEFHLHVLVQVLVFLNQFAYSSPDSARPLTDKEAGRVAILRTKAAALVAANPTGGPELVRFLHVALASDKLWWDWKEEKREGQDGAARVCAKYECAPVALGPGRALEFVWTKAPQPWDGVSDPMAALKAGGRGGEDALPARMQRMVEALDPASGIEEEYHPRNDVTYCWLGLRAASEQRLDLFARTLGGSFEDVCRASLGMEVLDKDEAPAPAPLPMAAMASAAAGLTAGLATYLATGAATVAEGVAMAAQDVAMLDAASPVDGNVSPPFLEQQGGGEEEMMQPQHVGESEARDAPAQAWSFVQEKSHEGEDVAGEDVAGEDVAEEGVAGEEEHVDMEEVDVADNEQEDNEQEDNERGLGARRGFRDDDDEEQEQAE